MFVFFVFQESQCDVGLGLPFLTNVVVSCAGGFGNAAPLWVGPMGEEKTVPMMMAHSRVSFVPRVVGRGAFHLAETVQAGSVPVQRYDEAFLLAERDSTMGVGPDHVY